MKRWAVLIVGAALAFSGAAAQAQDLRPTLLLTASNSRAAQDQQDLSGAWTYSKDLYRTGLTDINGWVAKSRMQRHRDISVAAEEARGGTGFFEFDMDRGPTMQVPGAWNSAVPELRYYDGLIWFQRPFTPRVVKAGERSFLRFEAVNYRAHIWLNGKAVGTHEGGFTPFVFEVTTLLRAGENRLTVGVDSQHDAQTIPTPITDWDLYGGITRPVRLLHTPATFIDDASLALMDAGETGRIRGEVQLNGPQAAERPVQLTIAALGLSVQASTDAQGRARFDFPAPAALQRWSPEDPALYAVRFDAGQDQVTDRIGFRTIAVRGSEILLNGKPIFLRGVSMHEEEFGANPARRLDEAAARALLTTVKNGLNGNYIRLSHYPHSEVTLRLADELGLLVWSEIPVYWTADWSNPDVLEKALRMQAETIYRDRNRAAVVLWSIGNETPVAPPRTRFHAALADTVRALDPTRLVAAALLMERRQVDGQPVQFIADPLLDKLDVMAVNTYAGWYGDDTLAALDTLRWALPTDKPLLFSEFGADALAGLHDASSSRKFSEEFQAEYYRRTLAMAERIPNLRGMSPWILKDFRSPRREHPVFQNGWNRKGLMSETGVKKLAFDVLAANYRQRSGVLPRSGTLTVDASRPPPPPRAELLKMGANRSPSGQVLAVNDRYLTLDGRPLIPVMGEFHYSRYPRAGWEEQLLKMKAAGVTVVSSYLIWQHHEERSGVFDWTGERDLRHFVQLAQRHGLMVFLRPGPWVHAEVRHGGLPDSLVDAGVPLRGNDPEYLRRTQAWFAQVAAQLQGLLWKDGGPVMGLQIENEYNRVGPLQGAAHIAQLKQMLLAQGLDVPLYTVTGWDHAVWPRGEVIPVFGSYVDEPWATASGVLPPRTSYLFQFGVRNEQGLGAQAGNSTQDHGQRDADITPFFGAEYGAGVPQMYRRRPLIEPQDIAAMVVTKLGSGVNLLGYYMFQGGQNPLGTPWRGEAVASGGYNDVPHLGYDFQAPLGQYGQAQPVLQTLRPLHLFLLAFGEQLAAMTVYAPDARPAAADDLQTLRWAFRGDGGGGGGGSGGHAGFIFVNNHVRQHTTPAHADTRFTVKLADRTLTLPTRGVTVAPGAAFIWPVQMRLPGGVDLLWATAQPLTRVDDGAGELVVFAGAGTEAPEFVFGAGVKAQGVELEVNEGRAVLRPAAGRIVTVEDAQGHSARFAWLTAAQAQQVTVVTLRGRQHLLLSAAHAFGRAGGGVELRQTATEFRFGLYPAPGALPQGSLALRAQGQEGLFAMFAADARPVRLRPDVQLLRPAGRAPPVPRNGPRLSAAAPLPESFGVSAAWTLRVPADALAGLADLFLDIAFEGDIARLFAGNTMLDDSYYIGQPWRVGLKRYAAHLDQPLTLTLMPLRVDAGITFDVSVQPHFDNGQVARLEAVRLTPLYALVLQEKEEQR